MKNAALRRAGHAPSVSALYAAVLEGAVERVHSKMMPVVAIMAGLWGTGTGSKVISRIAAPMVGGMIFSTVLTLAVIPAIYGLVKQWRLVRGLEC